MKALIKPLKKQSRSVAMDKAGSVGIVMALLLVPLLGIIGAAIDFSQAISAKVELQQIADATAVSGARLPATSNDNRQIAMEKMYEANISHTPYAGTRRVITANNAQVSVDITYSSPTNLLKLVGVNSLPINVGTTARSQVQNGGVICLLALNPDAAEGLHLQGINKMSQRDCWAWVNSTSAEAINAVGASTGTAQGFCVAGGVIGGEHFAPPPYQGCDPYEDPFAAQFAAYRPFESECTERNLQVKNGYHVLSPGTYCGGISLKPQAEVQLEPGIYIIKDGSLDVQAQSMLKGEGVTFYFTGSNTGIDVKGGGGMELRAAADGPMAGFLFVQDRTSNPGSQINIQGGGRVKMEGVLYTPTWRVSIGGNGEVNQEAQFWTMIADSFHMEGNGRLFINSDAAAVGLPDIMPKIPTGPMLLR